jgi:hypothetical protein
MLSVATWEGGGSSTSAGSVDRCTPCLLMGERRSERIFVWSLLDRSLLCVHCTGLELMGLCGTPGGESVLVCDADSKDVVALPWPLPGMGMPAGCVEALVAPL